VGGVREGELSVTANRRSSTSTMRRAGGFSVAMALLVVVACGGDSVVTTGPSSPATPTTGAPTPTPTPAEGFVYRTGIFQDTTTDNFWASRDTQGTVWNAYVLMPTKPQLFSLALPGFELTNDLAVSPEPGVAQPDGDGFSITVEMREDAVWSDGEPITAADVAFTATVVRDLGLGGNWVTWYQWAPEDDSALGLTAVEAIDEFTVRFTWNRQPGLAIWPHAVGFGKVVAQHFWQPAVDAARDAEDPVETLYAASGIGDPSGGPTIFAEREAGAFTRVTANPVYYDRGREVTSGGVTYSTGPFMSEQTFELYGDQTAAVLALKAGEVDFLYNPLGLQRGLQGELLGDSDLSAVVNPTNGFRYLGFNLRRDPMARQEFRDALAFMINKEYVADSVLQGVAYALYATVPEGNTNWFDEEKASAYATTYTEASTDTRWDGEPFTDADGAPYTATGNEARLHLAVKTLMAGGFSWPEGQEPDYANNAIVPGSGIMLDGAEVQPLTVLAPGPGYDPLRATYSLIIAQALEDLGFEATAFPTDFNVLVAAVFQPDDAGELDYDMFILGWSLGSPALPIYHEAFWAGKNDTLVNGGNNNTGFDDPEFNGLIEDFNAAQTFEEAFDIMWQLEDILFEKKPYILLFDTGILEAYRSASITFPFTDVLSGLQFVNGSPGLVLGAA